MESGRGGRGSGWGSEPARFPLEAPTVAGVTVNKQQLFKPFQLMPSVAAIYLLRGRQGLPGAIKLFASSAFKSALPLATGSGVVYGQAFC